MDQPLECLEDLEQATVVCQRMPEDLGLMRPAVRALLKDVISL